METAAAPAREWLAPLAVLVWILATVVGGVWCLADGHRSLLVAVLPGGLALTALAGRRAYGMMTPFLAGFFTLLACFPAFVIVLWASYQSPICSKEIHGIWNAVLILGGLLVFFALGVFGFRTRFAPAIVPDRASCGRVRGGVALLLRPRHAELLRRLTRASARTPVSG